LPTGEADGVRIVRERGAIVVVFTDRAKGLWRRVAGKRVSVMCAEWSAPDAQGFVEVSSGGAVYRAPKRGRRIRTGDLTRGMDLCEVALAARRVKLRGRVQRLAREVLVTIPLTQKGAVHLDEYEKTGLLLRVLALASFDPPPGERYRSVEELQAVLERVRPRLRLQLATLTSRDDTPPAGTVGYYFDGAEHVAAVILSATGRRLFIEYEAGGVLRTNVAQFIYGDGYL
jgi:hypothetical protein